MIVADTNIVSTFARIGALPLLKHLLEGAGESESIAVSLHRAGARFLTNDKRARNYCRQRGIFCLDLPGTLRALWLRKILSMRHGVFAESRDGSTAAYLCRGVMRKSHC